MREEGSPADPADEFGGNSGHAPSTPPDRSADPDERPGSQHSGPAAEPGSGPDHGATAEAAVGSGDDAARTAGASASASAHEKLSTDANAKDASEGGKVRVLALVVVAVVAVGLLAVLGILNPPRDLGVRTDRLGPENAERVSDYLARAADSLTVEDNADHWALLSFTEPLPPDQLSAHTGGLRIGQVLYQVPIPRVRTPLTTIPVPANETAIRASAASAAGLMRSASTGEVSDERYRRILQVSAQRLEAGCACAVAVVVRGPLDRLRELRADPAIRAVEALPADAVAGHYGVAPLLPEHTETVLPGPDDGPVPGN